MKKIHDHIINIEKRAQVSGISISQLCKDAGISNSTFTRWKSKVTKPSFDKYLKLLAALEHYEKSTRT